MTRCFFASDLHGSTERYKRLFSLIGSECPDVVLLGGDLLPSSLLAGDRNANPEAGFLKQFLIPQLRALLEVLGESYPKILLILGNDDPRSREFEVVAAEAQGLLTYMHKRCLRIGEFTFFGYSHVPPSPFLLKDWERYDVSRFTDVGCVSPEEGFRTLEVPPAALKYGTIAKDLSQLAGPGTLLKAVFLFHAPPYRSLLDRAELDSTFVDDVPLDLHIGSIAIRRFIEQRQPLLSLHGHVHEAARLSGHWRDRLGRTHLLGGAHDGPELSLIRFALERPELAQRELV